MEQFSFHILFGWKPLHCLEKISGCSQMLDLFVCFQANRSKLEIEVLLMLSLG